MGRAKQELQEIRRVAVDASQKAVKLGASSGPLGAPVLVGLVLAIGGRIVHAILGGGQHVRTGAGVQTLATIPWAFLALTPVGERTHSVVRVGLGSFAALLSAQWGLSLTQAGGFVPLLLQAFGIARSPSLIPGSEDDAQIADVGALGSGVRFALALPGPQRPVVTEYAAGLYHLLMGWWEAVDAHRAGVSRAEILPSLVLTNLYGPLGVASYLLLREGRKGRRRPRGAASPQHLSGPHALIANARAGGSATDLAAGSSAAAAAGQQRQQPRSRGAAFEPSASAAASAHYPHSAPDGGVFSDDDPYMREHFAQQAAAGIGGPHAHAHLHHHHGEPRSPTEEVAAALAERDALERMLVDLSQRFQEVEGQKQVLEASLALHDGENAHKISELQAALAAMREKAARAEQRAAAGTPKAVSEAQQQAAEMQRRVDAANAEVAKWKAEKDKVEKMAAFNADRKLQEYQEAARALEEALQQAAARVTVLGQEKGALDAQVKALQAQLEAAESRLRESEAQRGKAEEEARRLREAAATSAVASFFGGGGTVGKDRFC